MVPTELFVVSVLRALVEVAGMFLLGQGVLYLLAGARREKNAIYQLFQIVTRPVVGLVRRITPRVIVYRHIPVVRNIVRIWPDGIRVHGTWSHGTVPIASPGSAPLRAICVLRQARENVVRPVATPAEAVRGLVPRLIRPLVVGDWWQRTLDIAETIVREIPCYELSFGRGGGIVDVLREALAEETEAGARPGTSG